MSKIIPQKWEDCLEQKTPWLEVKARPFSEFYPAPLTFSAEESNEKAVTLVAKPFDDYVSTGSSYENISPRAAILLPKTITDETAESKFEIRPDSILVRGSKRMTKLCNFNPVPIAKKVLHHFKREDEIFYEFLIYMKNSSRTFSIKATEIDSFYRKLRKEIPFASVFTDLGKGEALLAEFISVILEENNDKLKICHHYGTGGWYTIENAHHYFSALDENCESTKKLADISASDQRRAGLWALHFLDIADLNVSLPLFLFSHSGFLYELFQQAGIPIQFVFAIIGISGSRKTSVSKILYCLFQKYGTYRNFLNFTATPRSMELVGEENKDAIVLLDDLSNSLDTSHLQKFEGFLRQICDQEGRRRSTAGGKNLDIVNTKFTAVLTAETYFEEMPQSSKLRNIAIFLNEKSINNSILSEFQENERTSKLDDKNSIFEMYMTGFIRYTESNWNRLQKKIACYQPPPLRLQFDRLSESRRVFHIIADLVLGYMESQNVISKTEFPTIFAAWIQVLDGVILTNQALCQEAAPEVLFIEAVKNLYANGMIKIAEQKLDFERSPHYFIGFKDNEVVKLSPEKIYEAVLRYYLSLNRKFSYGANALFSLLVSKGIAEGYPNKSRKNQRPFKKVLIQGKTVQFLCIRSAFIINQEV